MVEEEVAAEGSCHLFAEVKMGGFEVVMARGGGGRGGGRNIRIAHLVLRVEFCRGQI